MKSPDTPIDLAAMKTFATEAGIPASILPPDFKSALIRADEFATMEIPPRASLLGNWMKEGDLGYLFAPRGVGKTWMALLLGRAIATGDGVGEWHSMGSCPVFYLDAEMNLADVQQRMKALSITTPDFHLLSSDKLFSQGEEGVNIAHRDHQDALSDMLPDGSVFIIDNLSTAQVGMEENSNDAFDALRVWLQRLRARNITVIVVHHAGRNGNMRGASRREDMAHWIIRLKGQSDEGRKETTLISSFEKARNCAAFEVRPLRWRIHEENGEIVVECQIHSGMEAVVEAVASGLEGATEIAEELGISKSQVSKLAAKAIKAGLLTKARNKYVVVQSEAFPELPEGVL